MEKYGDKIKNICLRYKCEFVSCDNNGLTIVSTCGHTTHVSARSFVKFKFGVYCDQCIVSLTSSTAKCFKCTKQFVPTEKSFLFCSDVCTHSRDMTNEKREKIKNSVLKTIDKKRKLEQPKENNKNNENDEQPKKKNKFIEYIQIKETYEKNKCVLVTSEEEFNNWKSNAIKLRNMEFDIVSSCGHATKSFYYGLTQDGTCIICKDCRRKTMSDVLTSKAKDDNGYTKSLAIQQAGIDIFKSKCHNKIIAKKAHDGCEATLLIKPVDSNEDLWLKIKLKATTSTNTKIGFRVSKICNDVVFFMIHLETKTIRFFLPETLKIKTYYVGKFNNNHTDNIVDDLEETLLFLYNLNKYNDSFANANMPVSKQMRIEYNYMLKRENTIDFLKFEQSNVTASVYNFKVQNKKFQEIVVTKQKGKTTFCANISKHCGHSETTPYDENDNDFYWFNLNDSDEYFYVIPEKLLIHNGYISTKTQKGKKYFSLNPKYDDLEMYRFSYSTINNNKEKNKLLDLINLSDK